MSGSSPLLLAGVLIASCVILYYGAHWLVRGAVVIATALGIPKTVVGLTLVAFGTSAPEMFVNVIAGLKGETSIALANVSGSNLTNICIGFGVCALAACVVIDWRSFWADCSMAVLSTVVVLAFLVGGAYFGLAPGLSLWALLPLGLLSVLYLISLRRRAVEEVEDEGDDVSGLRLALHCGLFLLGVGALYGGGSLLLESAIATAEKLNMPSSLIGLTIVAAGTSIPDTIASLVAARQGEHGIAVGNLIGSNISNVLIVLSATLLASRSALSTGGDIYLVQDYIMVVAVSLLFLVLAARCGKVSRSWGVLFLLTYFGYMGYRVTMSLEAVTAAAT